MLNKLVELTFLKERGEKIRIELIVNLDSCFDKIQCQRTKTLLLYGFGTSHEEAKVDFSAVILSVDYATSLFVKPISEA